MTSQTHVRATTAMTRDVPATGIGTILLFSITLFVSSVLLFTVQPLVGKMLLPLLGGTPAVWNTCMVFFQAALLLGYAYAHGSCRWLGVRRQVALHLVVLLLPLLALPIAVSTTSVPPGDHNPIPWLLLQLTMAVAAPFAVVSTTAPLLQRWFAGSGHAESKDPYFLYVASNIGSLLGLLAYPALLEPTLQLTQQSWFWATGYGLFVVLVLCCAWALRRSSAAPHGDADVVQPAIADESAAVSPAPTTAQRLCWIFLAFVPSSLMLGVTTYITTDIAAVPLLWVLPLGLYLLSFVVVFARRPVLTPRVVGPLLPFLLLPLTIAMATYFTYGRAVQILLHLVAFFLAAITCHGRLAASRPPPRYLTEFYFWMSVGGVLGGVFNALLAPLIFPAVFEYPLAMALACFAVPGGLPSRERLRSAWLDFVLPVCAGVLWAVWIVAKQRQPMAGRLLLVAVPALACLAFVRRPVRLALGMTLIVVGQSYLMYFRHDTLCLERNFFGVKRVAVAPDGGSHYLIHGATIHGIQFIDRQGSRLPLTYYCRTGPVGDIFDAFNRQHPQGRVAAIGLGTGTVAAYAQPEQHFTFYEIDPAVARIAQDPRYFTFLRDCAAPYDIILGDGRLTLARAPDGQYDLILLDAFNSDAIPTHLLTREALQLYLQKLAPGGWIVFHMTNVSLDLSPVVANLAAETGLACILRDDWTTEKELEKAHAKYAALARDADAFGELAGAPDWQPLRAQPGRPVWTDQFSNVLSLMTWR